MTKYIFDLDNTLVFTDELNSEAYNYALVAMGKEPIYDIKRVTREIVFSKYDLIEKDKNILLELKQKYFLDNIEKINKNEVLLDFLLSLSPSECMLWTSAKKCRVEAILNYLNLTNAFSQVFYSKKTNIEIDLENICQYFQCSKSQLNFYENDSDVRNELKNQGVTIL